MGAGAWIADWWLAVVTKVNPKGSGAITPDVLDAWGMAFDRAGITRPIAEQAIPDLILGNVYASGIPKLLAEKAREERARRQSAPDQAQEDKPPCPYCPGTGWTFVVAELDPRPGGQGYATRCPCAGGAPGELVLKAYLRDRREREERGAEILAARARPGSSYRGIALGMLESLATKSLPAPAMRALPAPPEPGPADASDPETC